MIPFMNEDFLLTNATARKLYHDVAAKMPIVDYHCHLDPQQIYEDVRFENITQVWLGGMFFLTDDKAASAVTGVILPIACGFAAYCGV